MAKLTVLLLVPLAVSFALGYYREQAHPALWRALVTTLMFSAVWWGTHWVSKWLERQIRR
jgi:hypothetical protein